MLFCVNRNDFVHTDRYAGEDYVFEPGQKVMLSLDAARHMFGVGVADKTPVMHRLGWAFKYNPETKSFSEDTDAVTKLKNFVFTKAKLIEDAPAPAAMPMQAKESTTLTLKK